MRVRPSRYTTRAPTRLRDRSRRVTYQSGNRDHAPSRHLPKPAIFSRRLLSLVVRSVAIASMSFAAAFGFLSGATSPGAHYDPHLFAIGVSALFGAACGAIGILISAHPPDEDRAARPGNAPRRGSGSQLGNQRGAGAHQELLRGAGRRDRAPRQRRRDHLRQRRLLRARRPRARRPLGDHVCAAGRRAERNHAARRRHAHLRPEDRCTRQARAGSPGAKSRCAPTAAARRKASAAT